MKYYPLVKLCLTLVRVICAISIGTLIMELQALRQCVEGIITKIKVFWELQQSIYFIYATMNEDIYATLCVESTGRI